MIRAALLALVMALAGCATCRNHPTACSVAGAIVAGSIAATVVAHERHRHDAAPAACVPSDRGAVYLPPNAQVCR